MRHTLLKLNTRLVALVTAVMLLLCAVPTASAAEISGTCGDGLTWTFADGRLTISGSGDMTNYNEWDLPPWYEYREQILWLTLPEGLTSVGTMAFYECKNLTAVTIPSTVTRIGELAFCKNESMEVLNLNSGLRAIGRSAFERCEKLQDLRLPDTVTEIGEHAFYVCNGLTYVTIPASVTKMGSGVFSYCHSLVRADVHAKLPILPSWTFYGCENLSTVYLPAGMTEADSYAFYDCDGLYAVYFGGTEVDAEELKENLQSTESGLDAVGNVTVGSGGNTGSTVTAEQKPDGSYTITDTTVTKTDNSTVSKTQTGTEDALVDFVATVVTPEGWDEVLNQIGAAEEKQTADTPMNVTIYVSGNEEIPQQVLENLKEMNVSLTVMTQSGAKFHVNFDDLDAEREVTDLDFSYMLTLSEDVPEILAETDAYRLMFESSSAVNTEVLIRLPAGNARNTASLYQQLDGELTFLQSVVVDDEGYAHFYLACVDREMEYLIGINVPQEEGQNAIVPEQLQTDYGVTHTAGGIEYVITGRTSSWNMNINQVTFIMVGVLLTVVVTVGVVMFALNKRKLKRGYVPDLDEEDYGE